MKKNKLMRLASGLMVLTLLSTCAISGTYAKYVTSGSGSDSARVAKFGVEVTAASTMFSETYELHDSTQTGVGTHSVVSSATGEKLVAPGTSGDMADIEISGTPEVAVEVAYEATVDLGDNWVYNDGNSNAYYCPITITVNNTDYYGLDYSSASEFENAVKAAITGYSKSYEAIKDLSTVSGVSSTDDLAISWAWAFEGTDDKQTDAKDTYLGDQAADGSPATIEIDVTCTVTQID
ncbi:MAG: hypothetical protein LUC98_13670 [Lachnospiraceae bacterium]|nr:hypothetical protein [Lachnospiraceae bacterium]